MVEHGTEMHQHALSYIGRLVFTSLSYSVKAAIRRPRIPAVEAPILMLLAAPVDEADAAESVDDAVELAESSESSSADPGTRISKARLDWI